jgi:hypothetical protein
VVPRAVIPVIAGLFIGVLFLTSNVAAQHDPRPHDVPIVVAGAPAMPMAASTWCEGPCSWPVRTD